MGIDAFQQFSMSDHIQRQSETLSKIRIIVSRKIHTIDEKCETVNHRNDEVIVASRLSLNKF